MSLKAMCAPIVAGFLVATLCAADAEAPHTRQQDLIGAWRLVSIQVDGAEVDPFYGKGSRGLLIYDKSGWFSVQIEGASRPAVEVPPVRPVQREGDRARRQKAAALDSYYAYYGTWSFDEASSTVTHHAKGALYPSEDQANYAQHVEIQDRRLIFSRTQNIAGHSTLQTKVWERVGAQ
jgi:hypothetical protein